MRGWGEHLKPDNLASLEKGAMNPFRRMRATFP